MRASAKTYRYVGIIVMACLIGILLLYSCVKYILYRKYIIYQCHHIVKNQAPRSNLPAEPSSMNHTMISMHERFDSFDKFHGESFVENEKRHHGLKDTFQNEINCFVN